MEVWIIVAQSLNRAIGLDGGMPWRLSGDLKRFKATTTGAAVVMGRRTYESIGSRPLPHRYNVVVSRSLAISPTEQLAGASDLPTALDLCRKAGYERVFVMGGGQLYRTALPLATHLDLTVVQTEIERADTFFPELKLDEWHLLSEEAYPSDEQNDYPVIHYRYERVILQDIDKQ